MASKYRGDPRTARQIIQDEKKSRILRVFPAKWLNSTYDEILKAAKEGDPSAQVAKKLLDDGRFDKEDNRKWGELS